MVKFISHCVCAVYKPERLKGGKNYFGRSGQRRPREGVGFLFRPQNAGRSLLGGERILSRGMRQEVGSDVGMEKAC